MSLTGAQGSDASFHVEESWRIGRRHYRTPLMNSGMIREPFIILAREKRSQGRRAKVGSSSDLLIFFKTSSRKIGDSSAGEELALELMWIAILHAGSLAKLGMTRVGREQLPVPNPNHASYHSRNFRNAAPRWLN